MTSRSFSYSDGTTDFIGYLALPDASPSKKPAILVCHDWSGCNELTKQKADELAQLGYVALAIDMYGDGRQGKNTQEKSDLMNPLIQDRKLLQQRILAAYNSLSTINEVDSNKIAAIGFCFGGLCALDLARSGMAIKGAVSFHGALTAPNFNSEKPVISAKILVLHGYDDPLVPPEQVKVFADEMTQAQVDWQIYVYSQTKHAFTNPQANDPDFGTVYNPKTDRRAWKAMEIFLAEVF
jgi:dienelactone hydrolase